LYFDFNCWLTYFLQICLWSLAFSRELIFFFKVLFFSDFQNKKFTLDLSITSLENAKAKLDAGIGTKFEVLEAEALLSRDQQSLNEKKIEHKINKISLKEILNIKGDFDTNKEQNLIGFWNH